LLQNEQLLNFSIEGELRVLSFVFSYVEEVPIDLLEALVGTLIALLYFGCDII
jgi:hypothetical protein